MTINFPFGEFSNIKNQMTINLVGKIIKKHTLVKYSTNKKELVYKDTFF